MTKLYRNITKKFMNKFHLFHFRNESDSAMKIYITVEKMTIVLTKIFLIELFIGSLFFNLSPLYNSYLNGMFRTIKPANATYEHACYFDLPFDYTTDFKGYLVVSIFNVIISTDVAAILLILDLYIFVIVFHLWGHIKLLLVNLANVPMPANVQDNSLHNPPWYNEEESLLIFTLLKRSMEHYKLIKQFMHEVSMAFGFTICYYYAFHQISGCILLVELSQMNTESIMLFGVLTFVLFQQLIQMSIIFELIGSQSEKIKDAVYGVPWQYMDTRNRQIVVAYLMYVQNPLRLKALGILPVGVKVMASTLKTSLSYFMLLRTGTAHK